MQCCLPRHPHHVAVPAPFFHVLAELRPLELIAVVRGGGRPKVQPPETPFSAVLRPLMEMCWDADPEARPQFWEIMKYLEERDRRLVSPDAENEEVRACVCCLHVGRESP